MGGYFYTLEERVFIYRNLDKMKLKDIAIEIGRPYKSLSGFVVNAGWSNKRSYTKEEEVKILQGEGVEGKSENAIRIKRCRLMKKIKN